MKGLFKLLGAIFTFQLGAVVAMLFAQKTGKTLRKDLNKSDNPFKTLLEEGLKIDKEILGNVKDWAENSEGMKELVGQLDEMKDQATAATDDLKKTAKKTVKKKTATAKKAVKAKAKTVKKAAKKTAVAKAKAVKKVAKKSAPKKKAVAKKTTAKRKTNTKAVKKKA